MRVDNGGQHARQQMAKSQEIPGFLNIGGRWRIVAKSGLIGF
jgi:hypothetical protein